MANREIAEISALTITWAFRALLPRRGCHTTQQQQQPPKAWWRVAHGLDDSSPISIYPTCSLFRRFPSRNHPHNCLVLKPTHRSSLQLYFIFHVPGCQDQVMSRWEGQGLFFLYFWFSILHHMACSVVICREGGVKTCVLLLHDTTQRGGGRMVAQGDVVPICLVEGRRYRDYRYRARFCFVLFLFLFGSISPSPPLPLGYIVVWRRAKKHLSRSVSATPHPSSRSAHQSLVAH